ncbi:PrsW family intramembrane metalloprotease [Rhodocytophaga rosea]|uniref:Protease PrsW n=1 Tax=Rhodocytophaga rosea TaxID=2704465 RepID=A0A6C0GP06_9BACT|nr:PrsW family glutamic-type intramembrane protease [Rhodocytophaga rosea]QHT69322.1 PrsW family intramembrane metalloprotease [Rhodocytophaga rosea]
MNSPALILILLTIALAPGLAIAMFIYERDKLDKEPFHLLIKTFFLGILSIFPAILIEFGVQQLGIVPARDNVTFTGIYAIIVGFVEEACKYAILIWFAYPRKEFDEPFDGITYAVMIAMGFATFENISYVVDQGVRKGFMEGMNIGLWRMISAVPAHGSFAILMGYYVGMAKFKHQGKGSPLKLAGLFTAVGFHAAYDFCLLMANYRLMFIGAFLSLFIGIGLSLRAIQLHNRNSPFMDDTKKSAKKTSRKKEEQEEQETEEVE